MSEQTGSTGICPECHQPSTPPGIFCRCCGAFLEGKALPDGLLHTKARQSRARRLQLIGLGLLAAGVVCLFLALFLQSSQTVDGKGVSPVVVIIVVVSLVLWIATGVLLSTAERTRRCPACSASLAPGFHRHADCACCYLCGTRILQGAARFDEDCQPVLTSTGIVAECSYCGTPPNQGSRFCVTCGACVLASSDDEGDATDAKCKVCGFDIGQMATKSRQQHGSFGPASHMGAASHCPRCGHPSSVPSIPNAHI